MTQATQRTGSPSGSTREINIRREMWGIVILGLSVLLAGALLSLMAGDGKLMGPFGQLLALGLYAVFGMGSWLVIAALFSISWGIFSQRFSIRDARLWLGYSGATITGTIILFLLFPSYRLQGLSSGGKTGEYLGTLGISFFSRVGSFLIFSIIMVLFLVLATQASPITVARTLIGGIKKTGLILAAVSVWIYKNISSLFTWGPEGYTEESSEQLPVTSEEKTVEVTITKKANETASPSEYIDSISALKEPAKIKARRKSTPKIADTENDINNIEKTVPVSIENDKIEKKSVTSEVSRDPEPEILEGIITDDPVVADAGGIRIHAIVKSDPVPESSQSPRLAVTDYGEFILPDIEMLHYEPPVNEQEDRQAMIALAERLVSSMVDYKIKGRVEEIHPGPVVTMYEFVPEAGIRVSKIESLDKDLALSLAATRVRIVAPIPGKSAVGIEVPNEIRQTVYLKELITSDLFTKSKSYLTMVLGKDIKGRPVVCDLAKAPHLLVAGSTGSGKSVGINTMIMSILYRATPKEVKFILIDPKMVELSIYNDIPHLLLPVVTDPGKASLALQWAVREMERRYALLAELHVRNLADYNTRIESIRDRGIDEIPEHLPSIVIVIDEFADLMMVAAKDVEIAVARIAQKARAVGIHLIVATQRPSTDVITGLIKSNFPTRIAFMVSSRIDSKVVLDKHGAETLLGNGDMLYADRGLAPARVHGSYVSTAEIMSVVEHLRSQGTPSYDLSIVTDDDADIEDVTDEPLDSKWDLAVDIISRDRIASISYLQRKLKIGYNRAARIIERMEIEGIVSRPNHQNQREVLVSIPPD
ncbi:DNA translocase FtsK 4TM domain-containing protein [Myxococcota bacterium]|nr:DNA translocase FtsK 4TM domain-containing protein [Myxococcota bacterium]MBU1381135.1 DNA translocase FtsK 4TM domain-containing protein [Myxococcota bacterium]MBU1496707.1 DNA translocase FtsK 4TM domain-containing protein [Myxococcota bacterium]